MAAAIVLSKPERQQLETRASPRSASVRLHERARIGLRTAAGLPNQALAAQLGLVAY